MKLCMANFEYEDEVLWGEEKKHVGRREDVFMQ